MNKIQNSVKILINFAPIKSGGGQTVALNFLSELIMQNNKDFIFYFAVAKNTKIHEVLKKNRVKNYFIFSKNPLIRILQELIYLNYLVKKKRIDIVHSYFGFALLIKSVPQITCSADSNLYYPDLNFWAGYKGLSLVKRIIIDKYRIYGLKRMKGVIFENEHLRMKYHELYDFTKETKYIKPSINISQTKKILNLHENIRLAKKKGLFLCGWHLNKNIMLIPELAKEFQNNNVEMHFILTAPIDNSSMHKEFNKLVAYYNVHSFVSIIGQINREELPSLYSQIDFVFLLSKLESFSNNIIESWYFNKTLIISDEPWSRSICKDAALYVNRNSTSEIVKTVIPILKSDEIKQRIINAGRKQLDTYPSIRERTFNELQFIKEVYEKN